MIIIEIIETNAADSGQFQARNSACEIHLMGIAG